MSPMYISKFLQISVKQLMHKKVINRICSLYCNNYNSYLLYMWKLNLRVPCLLCKLLFFLSSLELSFSLIMSFLILLVYKIRSFPHHVHDGYFKKRLYIWKFRYLEMCQTWKKVKECR